MLFREAVHFSPLPRMSRTHVGDFGELQVPPRAVEALLLLYTSPTPGESRSPPPYGIVEARQEQASFVGRRIAGIPP